MKYIALALVGLILWCAIALADKVNNETGQHIVLINGARP